MKPCQTSEVSTRNPTSAAVAAIHPVAMPSHLTKRPPRPDGHRRPNVWRFITTDRFGPRAARRASADHGGELLLTGPPGLSLEQADRSDPALASGDEDAESLCSRYSDAHSSWSHHPPTNREEAISQALDELLEADMHGGLSDGPPEHEPRSGSSGGARDLSSGVAVNRPDDGVVSIADVSTPLLAYLSRDSAHGSPILSPAYIPELQPTGVPAHQPSHHDQVRPPHAAGDDRSMPDAGRNKNIETPSLWSSTANPWLMIDGGNPAPDARRDLLDENARLRDEIRELRRLAGPRARHLDAGRAILNTPPRPPSVARSSSRLKKSRQRRRPDVALFETTTLRDLILKRLFTPHVIAGGIIRDEKHPVTLDTPLTPAQIHDFTRIMNDVIVSGSHLKQPIALCAVCHLPKFKGVQGLHQNSYVSEVLEQLPTVSAAALEDFDPVWGTSGCCRRYVCKTCLSAAIISGIGAQWWADLANGETNWLKCPVPCCGRNLPLHSGEEVRDVLERLGMPAALPYAERFERANTLRRELQKLDPAPGREELRRSKALHDRLVRNKLMRPLQEDVPGSDDEEIPKTVCFPVDTADGGGTLQIPIFAHLLQPRTPRTCLVCDETYGEFSRGSPQKWARTVKGFGGEWTWRVLSFPAREMLPQCRHDLDICRDCLEKYVTARLETQGHGAVDNIACPRPDCSHRYTHAEIRCLASPESFAVYDRYTVLNSISSLPNFRWCLREGCVSGGLYDDPSSPTASDVPLVDRNCIECSDCSFAMCYTCQSPWHAGLTCAQHASQRDASFTETRTWLAQHTKPCPGDGCGVQVQKGDGCFHMTCSRCRFEFCWECLADWRGIFVPGEGAGFLRADGHREGCFFRGEEAPLPTQIMGQDLETGLRRLQEQEAGAAVAAG